MRTTANNLLGGQIQSPMQAWICPRCTTRASPINQQARREFSRARTAKVRTLRLIRDKKATNRIFVALATATVGATAYWMRDEIRHGYLATVRSARVVKALYVNIQE